MRWAKNTPAPHASRRTERVVERETVTSGRGAAARHHNTTVTVVINVAFSTDAGATWTAPIRAHDERPLGRVDIELISGDAAMVSWLETGAELAEVRARRVEQRQDRPVLAGNLQQRGALERLSSHGAGGG